MKLTIRKMTLDDVPAVIELDQKSFSLPWPERSFRFELTDNPASRCWVAELDGKMVGMIGALILVAEGILGFVTVFFPQDPIGSPATTTGNMHIILASLSSLTTMLAMFSSACGPGSCQICAITGSTLLSL